MTCLDESIGVRGAHDHQVSQEGLFGLLGCCSSTKSTYSDSLRCKFGSQINHGHDSAKQCWFKGHCRANRHVAQGSAEGS